MNSNWYLLSSSSHNCTSNSCSMAQIFICSICNGINAFISNISKVNINFEPSIQYNSKLLVLLVKEVTKHLFLNLIFLLNVPQLLLFRTILNCLLLCRHFFFLFRLFRKLFFWFHLLRAFLLFIIFIHLHILLHLLLRSILHWQCCASIWHFLIQAHAEPALNLIKRARYHADILRFTRLLLFLVL